MKRARGNWVDGDRFWDRDGEIADIAEYLAEGAHLLLSAPRRMGKTSLIREIGRRNDGKYCWLFVDLEKSKSASDAIVELSVATRPYKSLWGKTTDIFSSVLDKVRDRLEQIRVDEISLSIRSGVNNDNWQAKGDELFSVLAESEVPVILFLDEAPILVNRILKGSDFQITDERRAEAESFLTWLRANALKHQGKVRIILTGSIGMMPILRQAGLSATMNNFQPYYLGPWSPKDAIGCLKELAAEYGVVLEEGVPELMVEKIGLCIPHHVQMFFDLAYSNCKVSGEYAVSVETANEIYNNGMLGVRGHAELSHMEERLKQVLGKALQPLALELLTEAAVSGRLTPDGVKKISATYKFESKNIEDVVRLVLMIFEHDGYLSSDSEGNLYFASNLLRDWWKRHFGTSYIPLSAREIKVKD